MNVHSAADMTLGYPWQTHALARPPLSNVSGAAPHTISDDIVVLHDPDGARASDLRRVAQTIALRNFNSGAETTAISIISADHSEGRTTVAANLACLFAKSGIRVLLIDADHERPSIHSLFGLERDEEDGVEQDVAGLGNLRIMTSSSAGSFGLSCQMVQPLKALIERCRGHFGAIFVDTPPASSSVDYQVAALATGAVLAVTREGKTRVRRASRMLDWCDDSGIDVVGGVMLRN